MYDLSWYSENQNLGLAREPLGKRCPLFGVVEIEECMSGASENHSTMRPMQTKEIRAEKWRKNTGRDKVLIIHFELLDLVRTEI